jgi:hypothetical protein
MVLPFQPSQDVGNCPLLCFRNYQQPEDVKSSLIYFRFFRINFHPLKAFDIPHEHLMSYLIQVLAGNLISGSMVQDLEEMVALSRELLSSDVSMSDLTAAIEAFSRTQLTVLLDHFVRERFRVFGVTGNSGETPYLTIPVIATLVGSQTGSIPKTNPRENGPFRGNSHQACK